MRHAYLLITHEFTPILETLIRMIDDERNDIYVHIDKKVRNPYEDKIRVLVKKSKLFFVHRVRVYWGHVSLVKAECILFQEARSNGPYSYYHLLSGCDLPIRSQDEIHKFFEERKGREFISFSKEEMPERVMYRWPFPRHLRGMCSARYWIGRKINIVQYVFAYKCVGFQEKLGLANRVFPIYKKGVNWVSLTEKAVDVLLKYKNKAIRGFKYANCPDEHYKQTILFCVKNGLLPPPPIYISNLLNNCQLEFEHCHRFITWGRGTLDLTIKDYDEIINSDAMFCRKVVDVELAKKLYERCAK